MEREVWLRAGMFATIIVLVALILVTPNLLGHPSELASLPVLIVAMTPDRNTIIVDVTAAVQAYLYDNLSLQVNRVNSDNTTGPLLAGFARDDAYNAALYIPANLTPIRIHTRLIDQQRNYFEYNVTMWTISDPSNNGKLTMVFNFPDDRGAPATKVVPPGDFRKAIPRKGMIA